MAWKPEGYSTASPYLITRDAAATVRFAMTVLGAEELRRFPDEEGRLMHAEVRIGDTVIMLADSTEDWPPVDAYVHVYVADVDATYRRAVEAGAQGVQEPDQQGDEDKRGGVRDAGGTTWWIATRTA